MSLIHYIKSSHNQTDFKKINLKDMKVWIKLEKLAKHNHTEIIRKKRMLVGVSVRK